MHSFKVLTLTCTVLACLALLIAHVGMARYWLARHPGRSPQKATALLALVLNMPLIAAVVICGVREMASLTETAFAVGYAVLAFNCVAYSYFHFFNLSETGRRIRMLLQLLDGEHISARGTGSAAGYGGEEMVRQRLVRLMQMGQIREISGRYVIDGEFLLRAARLVRWIGRLTTGRAA